MSKRVLILGKDPSGKAKYANVTESGDLRVQLSGNMVSFGTVIERLHLYRAGNEYVTWDKGFETSEGTKILTKESDHFYLLAENPSGVAEIAIATNDPVDLTDVFYLEVEWEQTGINHANNTRSGLIIGPSRTQTYYATQNVRRLWIGGTFTRRVDTLDVRDITGSHFIRIHAVDLSAILNTSELRVYRVSAISYSGESRIPLKLDDKGIPYLPVKDETEGYKWLSNENKPTQNIPYLAFGLEVDTGTIYYWDGMKWEVYNI